jgi:hypothetical protein
MSNIDKSINFNAFHILLIIIIINIFMNLMTWNWEFVDSAIYYISNLQTPEFWFLMIHVILAYIILTSLQFEFDFRAAINFNL